MARHKVTFLLVTGALWCVGGAYQQRECDSGEYATCISMADPLIRNPKLVFPDTMADIDEVCRTWAKFVDCVKRYTDRCFSPARRLQFNQAVQRSVDSVHQMCTQTPYQAEYLSHASCIKATLTTDCGRQYGRLADLVADARPVTSRVHICCAHHEFRECVIRETKRRCDGDLAGPASRFALHILDKALSFLHEDCTNYIPMTGDCPMGDPPKEDKQRPFELSTPKYPTPRGESSRYPFGGRSSKFPVQGPTTTERPVEFSMPGDTTTQTPAPWTPAPVPANIGDRWTPAGHGESGQLNVVQAASSSRPATENPWGIGGGSFGGGGVGPGYGGAVETSTKVSGGFDEDVNQNYVHSTVSWYPDAANHHNSIDEPNQQPQQGYKGAAPPRMAIGALLLAAPLVLCHLL